MQFYTANVSRALKIVLINVEGCSYGVYFEADVKRGVCAIGAPVKVYGHLLS
jgi:hypothetical protein